MSDIDVPWGRIASLEEWKVHIRKVVENDDKDFAPTVCAACRQLSAPGE